MTPLKTIQSWPREQLESAFTQREDQLAQALEAEKLARAGFDKAAAERDQSRKECAELLVENLALKEQVESLEKQCAAMRAAITIMLDNLSDRPQEKAGTYLAVEAGKLALSATAGHNYKSPEEVAAIVDKCDKETTEFQFEIDNLHSKLTAHTQAFKMADGVLRDCERRGSNVDLVAIRSCIDTINNLLK